MARLFLTVGVILEAVVVLFLHGLGLDFLLLFLCLGCGDFLEGHSVRSLHLLVLALQLLDAVDVIDLVIGILLVFESCSFKFSVMILNLLVRLFDTSS